MTSSPEPRKDDLPPALSSMWRLVKLGYRHASVVDATGSGHYEVVGNGESYAPPAATSMAN